MFLFCMSKGDLGDLSKEEVNSQYREKIEGFVEVGEWRNAEKIAERMMGNSKRMGPAYQREALRVYDNLCGHKNPYGEAKAFYSLTLVVFALGGLMLLGNITGNVVGFGKGGSVVGAVLISVGVVGALVLSRWK